MERSWQNFLQMIPKCVLVMLVDCMCQFMDDDVVSKFWRKSHQLYIETDSISVTTAPPSGFLMATGDASVAKSEILCQLHCTVWQVRFCKDLKLF